MFAIAKTALKATRIERNGVKLVNKAINICPPSKKNDLITASVEEVKNLEDFLNKKIRPYSENIFKRIITWCKTFRDNYKLIKSTINDKVNTVKENYGELFTKKRQKHVKKIMINGINETLAEVKETCITPFKNMIEKLKNKNSK